MSVATADKLPWGERTSLQEGLNASDFVRFGELIHSTCGIKMPPQKKSMLEARLRKRLRSLGMQSFEEYADFVFSERGMQEELVPLLDVVTTNKTDFFREPKHFEFLSDVALPRLLKTYGVGIQRPLRVWSAGCSTGEEPYTLAMVLNEFALKVPEYAFSILATDLSTQVLDKARAGIYRTEKADPVPAMLKKKYLLRSKNPQKNQVRVVPELRAKILFHRLNFMDDDFGLRQPIDVVFFRNVMIYFNRDQQITLLQRLCDCLPPGRYLFTGHSESLHGMGLPVVQVAPAVYRKV